MERTLSRLKYSRYLPQASAILMMAKEEARILGRLIEITFDSWFGPRIYRCVNPCWIAVDEQGVLELLGSEFFWLRPGRGVREIVYRVEDDRFGEGTRGREVFHHFGEEGGSLPRLRWKDHDIFYLDGGSYTVRPEGIRN